MAKLPEGWTERTLGSMIPAAAWPAIENLIHAGQRTARDFMPVLEPYAAEMERNGVDWRYASYMLAHLLLEQGR